MGVNEVNVNGENIMDLTRDTVNENNLLLNETATDSRGEKVQGKVNPAKKSEAYLVTDIEGEIADEDYIPFNDVSDKTTPKKKTLFSSIVTKIQTVFNSVFATVTGNNIIAKDTFRQNIHTLEWLGTDIPDNSDLDTYTTAGNYRVTSDASGATIAHLPLALCGKVIVFNNGNSGIEQFYLANHNPRIFVRTKFGSDAWSDWLEVADERAHTYENGTSISASSDLNTYKTVGVYMVNSDADATTISNVPEQVGGKLIVSNIVASGNFINQLYFSDTNHIYVRMYSNSTTSWSVWRELGEGGDSKIDGYAVATISGNTITANITGFQLKAGTIVSLKLNGTVDVDCTININNTGAKYVRRNDYTITTGIRLFNGTYTFIYDGTYYRLISTESIGSVHSFPQNYVADTSGLTVLDWGFNLNKAEIKYNLSTDKLVWNYFKNNTWRGDVNIADFNDIVTQLGYQIPQNSDLNNYTHAGVFYVRTQAYADTILNLPIQLSGKLIVMGITNTNSWLRQFYFPNHQDKIYYRRLSDVVDNVGVWFPWVEIADSEDVGASVAKVGKSILPSWGYTTNTLVTNGITFTFNPTTGEITASGTATADASCILAGKITNYEYNIPKGQYILTGCPSGGSTSKYYIQFQYTVVGGSASSIDETGAGYNVTFTNDVKCDISNNQNFFIRIKSGQTVSNLVFKPMLRPAFTTAGYEPNEDIHKGNCYVGTCTTAGATKDKVAYVDGYFVLRKGVRVAIKFSESNTYNSQASSPVTLNVNDTGAKNIWINNNHTGGANHGTNQEYLGYANRYCYYIYDGTYWVWDGCCVDYNNTNYLPNNANAVLTMANSPVIAIKSSSIDSKQANNGVSSSLFPAYLIQDKNGEVISRLESVVETNGNISTYLYTRNIKTSDNTAFLGGIKILSSKAGETWYAISSPHNFVSSIGIGYGTCDTAEATTAKVASLYRYTIATNGYVTIRFTYAVPPNSTLNINSQGARAIYYRGGAIGAGIIRAGDMATFIYATGYYHLIGIDRQELKFGHADISILSSINSVKTGFYAEGNLNSSQLFFRIELAFKPTSNITVNSSQNVLTFNNLRLSTIFTMNWQDLQGYINYTTMIPCLLYNDNKLVLRFRSSQTFNANTHYTFRICFTTTAYKI